jgi:hypothetical protein
MMMSDKTTQERLRAISASLTATDIDLAALKAHLVGLLRHLASAEGRTDENCKAVDSFFCLDDTWSERGLPADFHDLLADVGGALHDTIGNPDIAQNFESTPEQLLGRARRLGTEPVAAGYSRAHSSPRAISFSVQMKMRLLRVLLLAAACAWGVSVVAIILPWPMAVPVLQGLGAGEIPADPMLDYWLRMAAGAFTGIGIFFLALAIWPRRFANVIGMAGALMFAEGLVLLAHGVRLGLRPFPFYADTAFCLLVGAGIWMLRKEPANPPSQSVAGKPGSG